MSTVRVGLAVAVGLGASVPLMAQTTQIVVPSGKASPIGNFFNCQTHLVQEISGEAAHGSVAFQRTTRDGPCGNKAEPVVVVIYTSEPGYKGPEGVNIFIAGGQNNSITITVR